jgi:mono/diheme cytochrome c family protein
MMLYAVGIFVLAPLGFTPSGPAEPENRGYNEVGSASLEGQKANPVPANPASIAAGRKIFMQRCAKCHGETGKGDGPDAIELKLHPAKFTRFGDSR